LEGRDTLKYAFLLGVLCLTLFANSIGSAVHSGGYPSGFRISGATPTIGELTPQPIGLENVTHIAQLAVIPTSAPVMDVAWSPDGSLFAIAEGSDIRLYAVNSLLTPKVILHGHTDTVNSIAFSPNGASIASGGDDSTVRIWDIGTGRQKAFQRAHSSYFGSPGISVVTTTDSVMRITDSLPDPGKYAGKDGRDW
jgi:WD40 repeat protein